jgi:hypothetical protein
VTDLPEAAVLRLKMDELIEVLAAVEMFASSMARIGGNVDDEAERADVTGRYLERADLTRRMLRARRLLWDALELDVDQDTILALEEVLEGMPRWPDVGPPYRPPCELEEE